MRRSANIIVATLLGLGAAACGGGSGGGSGTAAPKNASVDAFCTAYVSVMSGGVKTGTGKTIRDWGERLRKVGTPKDMSADARAGFEVFVDYAKSVDPNAKTADIPDPDVSDAEQKQLTAFAAYASQNCTTQMAGQLGTPGNDAAP